MERKLLHTTTSWPPPPPAWGEWGVWGQRHSVWSPTRCQRASKSADAHSLAPGSYCQWSEGEQNRILVSLPAWLDVCFSCTTLGHIMERKGQRKYSFSWIAVYFTSHLHARVWWNPCSHHCLHSRAVIWQHIRVWITRDRHTAREDTMTMKPPQDTFQTFHFKAQRDWEVLVRQFNLNLFLTNISAF